MAEDKKWFGRGIYGSKDVPIRILDGFIIGAICFVVILVFWFATHGGYNVTFDTEGWVGDCRPAFEAWRTGKGAGDTFEARLYLLWLDYLRG